MTKEWLNWAANVLVLVVLIIILFFVFTGPENVEQFLLRNYRRTGCHGMRVYRGCVFRGCGVSVSHRGDSRFAHDFYMPVGTDICAARDGEVVRVVQEHDGNGKLAE